MLLEILSVLIGCLILYKQNSCISLSLILFVYYNALHFLSDEVDMFVSYPCSKGSKPYRTVGPLYYLRNQDINNIFIKSFIILQFIKYQPSEHSCT